MAEPGLMGQAASSNGLEDNDVDGEYEVDDVEYDHFSKETSPDGRTTDAEGSEVDAEGSEIDAEGEEVDDEDEGEPVGAVKFAANQDATSEEDEEDDGDAAAESDSDAKTSDNEASDTGSSESEVENEWHADSENGDEPEAARTESNECIFCGEDEENDPSPEYEEYLACANCGDNAHRQCARGANTLSPDDDAKLWRCPACLQKSQDEEDEDELNDGEGSLTRRRLSSVPKLARDLLPSHRGIDRGGHSVFNDLILPDDPMDGSRSLRKRKSSHEEEVQPARSMRKRRRTSEASKSEEEAGASVAAPSPRARVKNASIDGQSDAHLASASEHESTRLRSARARRPKPSRTGGRPLAWQEEAVAGVSLVLAFHLNNERVQKILQTKPKSKQREQRRERDRAARERARKAQQGRLESPEMSHYPAIQPQYAAPFYGFADKEVDESKNKPFGGILSEADADTSKTYPTQVDRKRFEDARLKAEDDWKKKQEALYGAEPTRPSKQAGPPSKIKCINFGGWEIDTWHAAPYPEEYSKNKVLYICEFCLKYMNSDYVAWRHKLKCPAKHPPGDEIYRDGRHSFFEVDGRKNPVYCQNLCLLAKLFLGSKTLYYDVEPFLFYVMTENDNYGCHFVGYFSKEKRPSSLNNVSCILVLPIHMRKGYGQYLIEFSYLLTRVEKKTGSPEKPLSDMGLVSYRKYWRLVLCEELLSLKEGEQISITTISDCTGMTPDDIVSALEGLRALVRDPVTKSYALRLDRVYFKQYIDKCNASNNPKINPECLIWTPYVMGRSGQYEDGPALHTVQPREELEDEDQPAPEEGVQRMEMAAKNGTSKSDSNGGELGPTTPALPIEESMNGSPVPGTPLTNGSFHGNSFSQSGTVLSIPTTRYEIFPPIPGMPASKRRPGRPFGSRRRTSTPQRNRTLSLSLSLPLNNSRMQISPSKNGTGKASPSLNGALTPSHMRRTRSTLGDNVISGITEDDDNEGGEVKAVNGRATRSFTGSPNTQKGKIRLHMTEDEDEDEDANGEDAEDSELDADGEMDIDAEGEDDDDLVMGHA